MRVRRLLALTLGLVACAPRTALAPVPGHSTSTDEEAPSDVPSGERNPAPPPEALRGCEHDDRGNGVHRYACDGFMAGVVETPTPPASKEAALDALVERLTLELEPVRARYGADLRMETIDGVIDGAKALGAKIVADAPDGSGRHYGVGYALVAERRSVVCSATTAEGVRRCGVVIGILASGGR